MKRIWTAILAVWLCVPCSRGCMAKCVDCAAEAAVLLCADTMEVLYQHHARERRPMASTTKIMTALLTIEECAPDRTVRVTADMVRVEGTSMGLLPDDTVTLYALTCGMLLSSGNDAANTAAASLSGSVPAFAERMNARAAKIGMSDTHFVTPSGLDDANHYSTAYDMALLAAEALQNPVFRSICSAPSLTVSYGNPPYRRTLRNHNRLLSMYDGCIGVKTGFTKKSGRCLVSAAERDGVTLIAVTLNDPDDWRDHAALLDYGFSVVRREAIPMPETALTVPVAGSTVAGIPVLYAAQPSAVTAVQGGAVVQRILLPPFVYAPVQRGDTVGRAVFLRGGREVCSVDLIAGDSAPYRTPPAKKQSRLQRFCERIKGVFTSWHNRYVCKSSYPSAASPPAGKRRR